MKKPLQSILRNFLRNLLHDPSRKLPRSLLHNPFNNLRRGRLLNLLKKPLPVLLMLCALLAGCGDGFTAAESSRAAAEKLPQKSIDVGDGITDLCAFGSTVFMIDGDGLLKYDINAGEKLRIAEISGAEAVCCDENSAAVFSNGAVSVFDYSGGLVGSVELDIPTGSVRAIAKFKNSVLIVEAPKSGSEAVKDIIYIADIKKGGCTALPDGWNDGERDGSVADVKFIDENRVGIVFSYNISPMGADSKVCVFDLKEGEVTEARELNGSGYYCPENEKVYVFSVYAYGADKPPICGIRSLSTDGSLCYEVNLDNKIIGVSSIRDASSAVIKYTDGSSFVAWCKGRNSVWTVSLPDVEPIVVLAPLSDNGGIVSDANIEEIINGFSGETGIPVRINAYPEEEYDEKLRLKLLAQDRDFDVYFLRSEMLRSVLENGAYEPLNGYDGVEECFGGMTEGVKELMTGKDGIFGIPVNISMMWGHTVSADAEIELPMFWGYDEMYRVCGELKGSGTALFKEINDVMVVVADFIQDSVSVSGEIDEAEPEELLDNMLKFYSDGTLYASDGGGYILDGGVNYFAPLIGGNPVKDGVYRLTGNPSRSGLSYVTVAESLSINRASEKKKEAAALLCDVASEKNLYDQNIYMGAAIGKDPLENLNYKSGLWGEDDLYYLEKAGEILANSRPKTVDYSRLYRFLLFDENVLGDMFDGKATPSETAEKIVDEAAYTYFE